MTLRKFLRVLLTAFLAVGAMSASALDFHGYLREGPGFNSKGGTQACFQLPDSNFKARLGNECDRYGEFTLGEDGKANGIEWRAEFMPAWYMPLDGATGPGLFVQQAWVGIKIPALTGAQFWAGRRYYRRHDVHSLDWFYWNMAQGNSSAGVDDMGFGFAKGGLTLINVDATNVPTAGTRGSVLAAYMVLDARLYDMGVNPNGKLEVSVDVAMANDHKDPAGVPYLGADRAGTSLLFTAEHVQSNLLGGTNKLTFQYGNGALAKASGDGPRNVTLQGGTSKDTQWRVIEHFVFEPTPDVNGAFVFVYQDISGDAASALGNDGRKVMTVELRPAYSFTDYFKVSADLFYQTISYKNNPAQSDANLTKVTLAPTLVAGRGYYARPEIRLYATYASWNNGAAQSGTMAQGAFGTTTNGMNYGIQGEIWF